MKALCIDDEPFVLQQNILMCQNSGCFSSVNGAMNSKEALSFLEDNEVDLIFLDINMPNTSGLSLYEIIKQKYPHIALIFVTGYSEYALTAFQMHADGYLTKPISAEDIKAEVNHINDQKNRFKTLPDIFVQTFGNFEIYVKGTPVKFERKKSKELLAYLVDKRGTSVVRAELASIFWEDSLYDHSKQKQLDVFIQSLKKTLKEYDIQSIFEIEKGELRVNPLNFKCDYYDLLDDKEEAKQNYCDNYMNAYSWSENTKAYLSLKHLKNDSLPNL